MNALEIAKMLAEKKKFVEDKYGQWMNKIEEYYKEIENASTKYSKNSQQFIDKKIQMYKNKIEELKQHADNWMKEQLNEAQKWADGITSDINKQIESQTKQYNDTINAFK